MGFIGKVIWKLGARLAGMSDAGQSDPVTTEAVTLLERPPPVESMSQAGLAFPPVSVTAPAVLVLQQANAVASEPLLTSMIESPGAVNWSVIECGSPPQKAGFRPLTDPVEVDGFSLESPDDLPVRWRLLLPVLQISLDPTWSKELDFPADCQPYPYQWEGVRALAASDGFLLADDMGTGKTIQALLAARILFQKGLVKTMLVVGPISVLPQWKREAARWARLLIVDLVRGSPDERKALWLKPGHIKLTAYETLRQDQDWLEQKQSLKYDLIVLDEAQRIKNPGTATAQAVKRVEAARRWGLTGTPLENRLEEVRAICSYIRPGLLKSVTLTPQRVKTLLKPYLLRRRKEEVLKELPPKEEFEIWLKMGDKQQKAYDEMEKARVLELSQNEVITAQNILTLILELKKICNRDPRSGESIKGEWMQENLDDIAEAGHKALVFTQFRQPQFGGSEWIADELKKFQPMNYSEADNDKLREQFLGEFESNPERKVFIGHPRTAGLGLNQLVAANYVIHFDHWWNPATTNQATARAHRRRQTKKVFVYHLWVEGTIEEMILGKLKTKQALFDETIDSLASFASEEVLFAVYGELLKKYDLKVNCRTGKDGVHGRKRNT
jgi:SNF2 family DNA or RNA helicase